jgi:2,3-bisphosphoglycerate-independent phosphoglycerate mutase
MKVTPVVLLILDGFGYREEITDNAIAQANTPQWDALWKNYPHTLINASESFVGLPSGQMGNSEVGHLNIGAGRIVFQEFERINNAISSGEFFNNEVLIEATSKAKENNKALHILGLVSDGGVHSHQDHIHAMIKMAAAQGLTKIYIHAFLDGRDTPPISAKPYLEKLEQEIQKIGAGKIVSVCGRYYAMDRDKRWERIEPAYQQLTQGKAV